MPKRSKTERLGRGSQSVRSEAASHFPPSADNSRQPSSNVWGVGDFGLNAHGCVRSVPTRCPNVRLHLPPVRRSRYRAAGPVAGDLLARRGLDLERAAIQPLADDSRPGPASSEEVPARDIDVVLGHRECPMSNGRRRRVPPKIDMTCGGRRGIGQHSDSNRLQLAPWRP